jgi:hypothetical protein
VCTTRARRLRPPPHNVASGDLPRDPIYRARVPSHLNSTAMHAAAPARVPSSTEFHRRMMRRPDLVDASVTRGIQVRVDSSMMMDQNRWSAIPPWWLWSAV